MKEKIVKQYKNKDGYSIVKLTNDNGISQELRVDYLVAKAFVPNPHNYKNIKHIDGDLKNNQACNLEWVE